MNKTIRLSTVSTADIVYAKTKDELDDITNQLYLEMAIYEDWQAATPNELVEQPFTKAS